MSGKRRRQTSAPSHADVPKSDTVPEDGDGDTVTSESKLPRASQILGSLRELEAHYAKYHTHICQEGVCHQEPGGAKIFPDARLLELHQTEYHDEITALKNERGEKIFACFLESCPRKFRTPKGRRLHLISVHGYPKLYFFAVTKHGIGQLLERYGEGATLIRKEWKPRAQGSDDVKDNANQDSDEDDSHSDHDPVDNTKTEPGISKDEHTIPKTTPSPKPQSPRETASVDDLASSMKSLSLIPTSVRFGRGAKRSGFVRPGAARGGLSNVTPATTSLRNRGEGAQ
ncbi:hypothetical protein FRC10_000833 [Ceratobasidium sp. 414]|nr:hypothetical protein FRC10_000833 [Ceratobasidium sp. 414]